MRKEQEKIINKAKKQKLPEEEIEYLKNATYSIDILQCIYHYFCFHDKKIYTPNEIIAEVERCLSIPHEHLPQKEYMRRLNYYILPNGMIWWGWGENENEFYYKKLWKSHIKNAIIKKKSNSFELDNLYFKMLLIEIPYLDLKRIYYLYEKGTQIEQFFIEEYISLLFYEPNISISQNEKKDFINNRFLTFMYYCLDHHYYLDYKTINKIFSKFKRDTKLLEKVNWDIFFSNVEKDSFVKSRFLTFVPLAIENLNTQSITIATDAALNFEELDKVFYDKYPLFLKIKERLPACFENSGWACWNSGLTKDSLNMLLQLEKKERAEIIIKKPSVKTIGKCNTDYINLEFTFYENIAFFQGRRGTTYGPKEMSYSKECFITKDGRIFNKNKDRIYPVSIKDFIRYQKLDNGELKEFLDIILENAITHSCLAKDVLHDCWGKCLIPISFNQLYDYYNKAHFLKSTYKLANELPIDWNKININIGYMIIKSYPYVKPGKSQQILLNEKDKAGTLLNDFEYIPRMRVKSKIEEWLSLIIVLRIRQNGKTFANEFSNVQTGILEDETDETLKKIAKDYVHMTLLKKKKVDLAIRSHEELENKHDECSTIGYNKVTGKVRIPEDTVFRELRKILPEEFEWITTRKRLINETKLQGHCVWSYADEITNDKCAIYSYVDYSGEMSYEGNPKRYTIEFRYDRIKNKYFIEQTQGKYDRVNASKMSDYINKILDEYYQRKSAA